MECSDCSVFERKSQVIMRNFVEYFTFSETFERRNTDFENDSPQTSDTALSKRQQPQKRISYRVYTEGMPVPFDVTTNTPYLSYVPPQMPHEYYPYFRMPHPGSYHIFPGNFHQGCHENCHTGNFMQHHSSFQQSNFAHHHHHHHHHNNSQVDGSELSK